MKKIFIIIISTLFTAPIFAQKNKSEKDTVIIDAKYDGGDIVLTYHPPLVRGIDSVSLNIYRKDAKGEKLIKQKSKVATNRKWLFADTTTRKNPGVYDYRIVALADNVSVREDKVRAYAYPPDVRPIAGKFKAVNKKGTNNISLSWKIDNSFILQNITIQRSRKKTEGYQAIASLQGSDTVYVDNADDANEPFFYRLDMSTIRDGRIYQSASIFVLPDFAIIPMAATNVKAIQKNKSIVVTWENFDDKARGFYVKKRTENKGEFITASSVITKDSTNKYEWKDTTTALVVNQMYQYVIVSESNSFDKSNPSDTVIISFINNDVRLSPPQNISIITANDTIYNLAWVVDSLRMKEIAGYAVYVKKSSEKEFKQMENGITTADVNYIRIPKPRDGDTYKVQSVNGDKQSVFSLPFTYNNAFEKEFGPKYLKAGVIENVLHLRWLKSSSLLVKEYRLYKWNGANFDLVETISPDITTITVKSYLPGQLNMYQLKTVNANNLESNGSKVLQVN